MSWTPTKLPGYNARLATIVGGVPTNIAALQNVDFNASIKMVPATTVDDQGNDSFEPGTGTWSASAKCALLAGDATQGALLSAMQAKTALTITYYPIQGATGSGAPSYSGQCYVEDMKFASNGLNNLQTLDIKLQGTGAFTEVAQ